MAIINPEGFFNGDRLRRCSNAAQLHWPRLFLASDGFARLEINYARIIGRAYATFNPIPTEEELLVFIREYSQNHRLFHSPVGGQTRGQWDTQSEFLPRYKTAQDRRSPIPLEPAFAEWKLSYRTENKSFPKLFENLTKVSGNISVWGWGWGGGWGWYWGWQNTLLASVDERGAAIEDSKLTPPEAEKPIDEVSRWFDAEFWRVYPRKVAKPQALKAAQRHAKTATARVAIMECLNRRLPSLQAQFRTDGDFRPYPASWLNQTPWTEPDDTTGPAKQETAEERIARMIYGEKTA